MTNHTISLHGKTFRVGAESLEPEPLPAWLPMVLPPGWEERPVPPSVGREYARIYQKHETTYVIIACATYGDGKRWLHVSVSRKNKDIPTWECMRDVKDLFIGVDRTAYQVMPAREKWVNLHPGCLHLWHCLDGDVTPDFTAGGETI